MRKFPIVRSTRALAGLVLVAGLLALPAAPAPAGEPPDTRAAALSGADRVIPKPVQASSTGGQPFELGRGSEIVARGNARAVGEYLAGLLRPATGFDLPVTSGKPQRGDVVLDLGPGKGPAGHTAEGYKLTTERRQATIAADTPAGLFNGVQTLRQLFGQWIGNPVRTDGPWTASAAQVTDYPRFGYRGSMLDVARSFLTPDEVKRYIDAITQFKVNTLHLHLADDQAWRIVIDDPADNPSGLDYDALTRVGSHGGADVFGGSGRPTGTEPAHRGFYTKAEYRSIVAYAASRFVTVVPEIDGPGHVNAALASIPQLNPDGVAKPMNNTADVGYSTLQANDPVTYEFLTTVWRQLAELTPGPYLHIGGDEAHVTGHDNYLTYIGKVVPIINGLGKTTMGWNEYAAVDLPAGSVVQYWAGSIAPVLAQVARGAKVVMSPASTAYLDMKYNPSTPIGLSWACSGDCDWNRYYDWNPVQQGLTEDAVLGVEAPLWSETVRGIDQANFLAFPRMISVAEMGWTPQAARNVTDFGDRLAAVGGRLTVQGTNFYPSPKAAWTVDATAGDRSVRRSDDLAGPVARFTAPAVTDAGSVRVSIEYGDGTAAVPGSVRQPRPSSNLNAPGVFEVVGPSHVYAEPGSYEARVTVTVAGVDTVTTFRVTVRP
jgi:hexosaminidase